MDLEMNFNTRERSHSGASERTGGLSTKTPLTKLDIATLVDTVDPSGNPLWIAAIAERYPWMVLASDPDSYRDSKKSATSPTEERKGSTSLWRHHLLYPASLEL